MKKTNVAINTLMRMTPFLCIVFLLTIIGCSDDDDKGTPAVIVGAVSVKTSTTLGTYLADGNGMTLYVFSDDVTGQSACLSGCLGVWPVFYAENLEAGTGLSGSDFATITRTDGAKQTTYKGWPLYYFADDDKAGDTNGEAVGDIWFIVKPEGYSLMVGNHQLVGKDGKSYKSDYTEGTGMTIYFTDANGRTLYMFANDTKDTNTFSNGDATHDAIWPVFNADVDGLLPSTVDDSDFGSITVFGKTQLTYKGHPLYYFGEDTKPGDTKGVSMGLVGSTPKWPVVNTSTPEAE